MIERVVIDTNVLVSAALDDASTPARARDRALHGGLLVGTEDTIREFIATLLASKFDAYVARTTREHLIRQFQRVIEIVPMVQVIRACRDPKDDKFLEAAVNGRAGVIITSDKDLLALHPFGGIQILTPAAYLSRITEGK